MKNTSYNQLGIIAIILNKYMNQEGCSIQSNDYLMG